VCQYGQGVVRGLFEEFDVENLKGFAIWLPIMARDSIESARGEAATFEQFPISHAWDPELQGSELYAKMLNLGAKAWDVYLLYAPGVTWEGDEPPQPTFWMHQLPSDLGVNEELLLNPTRIFREIINLFGDSGQEGRADRGLWLHAKGLMNLIRERAQYDLTDIRQALEDSKVEKSI